MLIIDLEQGTQEWLSWRKTVITATDCPAILGSSPWTTAYKCWQKKLGLVGEDKVTESMERGKRLEPEARDRFIKESGINMTPRVVESSEYNFLGASLDGLSDCHEFILEVKCGGDKLHEMAANNVIPPYYMDQIQHQLFVTGAKKAFYYSYSGSEGICIEVEPMQIFAEAFMPKAREFWRCVALNEAPALQDSDYKDMSSDTTWCRLSKMYLDINRDIKELEEYKERTRKCLIELCDNQSCMGSGLRVAKTTVQGRVDYKAIPELSGIDLDQYRKASTTVWRVTGTED